VISPREYVKSEAHLPAPLRDFHDAKDFFKLLHRKCASNDDGTFEYNGDKINWVQGQCYVIDWFLHYMAQRGWTLQRSRAKVDFADLYEEIKQMKEEDAEAFRQALLEESHERQADRQRGAGEPGSV
jgi:hypothetical protein